jgi:hypothetical protein
MLEFFLIVIGIFLFIAIIFIITHLSPLTDDEIKSLADKRRKYQINNYYSFSSHEFEADKDFKKHMNANGKFYTINETLYNFPSLAAANLKYKKHEWIIFAFEKNKKLDLLWLNKGSDNTKVSSHISLFDILKVAQSNNYKSVLFFHNHPNTNPNYYDCTKPSTQDLKSASELKDLLNSNEINLIAFICERGQHYKYFLSIADSFFPISLIIVELRKENGQSKLDNLSLHFERIF